MDETKRKVKKAVAAAVSLVSLTATVPFEPIAPVIKDAMLSAAAEEAASVSIEDLVSESVIYPGTTISGVDKVTFENVGYYANERIELSDTTADVNGGELKITESGTIALKAKIDPAGAEEDVIFAPYHIEDPSTIYWEVESVDKENKTITLKGHKVESYFKGTFIKNENLGDNEVVVSVNGTKEALVNTADIDASDVKDVKIYSKVPLDFYSVSKVNDQDTRKKLFLDEEAGEFIKQLEAESEYKFVYQIVSNTALTELDIQKQPELVYDGKIFNDSSVTSVKINGTELGTKSHLAPAQYYDVYAPEASSLVNGNIIVRDTEKKQLVIESEYPLDIFADTGDGTLNPDVILYDSEKPDAETNRFVKTVSGEGANTIYKYTLKSKIGSDVNEYLYLRRAATPIVNGKLTNNTGDAGVRYVVDNVVVPVSAQKNKNVSDDIVVSHKSDFAIAAAWPVKIYDENNKDITSYFAPVVYNSNNAEAKNGLSKNFPYSYVLKDESKNMEALEIKGITVVKDDTALWAKEAKIKNDSKTELDLDGETISVNYKENATDVEAQKVDIKDGEEKTDIEVEAGSNEKPLPCILSNVQLKLVDSSNNDLVDSVFKMEALHDDPDDTDKVTGYKYTLIPQRDPATGVIKPYSGTVTVSKAENVSALKASVYQEEKTFNGANKVKHEVIPNGGTYNADDLQLVLKEGWQNPINVDEDENYVIYSAKDKLYIYEKSKVNSDGQNGNPQQADADEYEYKNITNDKFIEENIGKTYIADSADTFKAGQSIFKGDKLKKGTKDVYYKLSGSNSFTNLFANNQDIINIQVNALVESYSFNQANDRYELVIGSKNGNETRAKGNYYTLKPTKTGDISCITNDLYVVTEKPEIFEGSFERDNRSDSKIAEFTVTYKQNGTYGDQTKEIKSVDDKLSFTNDNDKESVKTNGATELKITSNDRLDFIDTSGSDAKVIYDAFNETKNADNTYTYTLKEQTGANPPDYSKTAFKVRKHTNVATFDITNKSSYNTYSIKDQVKNNQVQSTDGADTIKALKNNSNSTIPMSVYSEGNNPNPYNYDKVNKIEFTTPAKCKFNIKAKDTQGVFRPLSPTDIAGLCTETRNSDGSYKYAITANAAADGKEFTVEMVDDLGNHDVDVYEGPHNGFPIEILNDNGESQYFALKASEMQIPNGVDPSKIDIRWYMSDKKDENYKQVGFYEGAKAFGSYGDSVEADISSNNPELPIGSDSDYYNKFYYCVVFDENGEAIGKTDKVYLQKLGNQILVYNGNSVKLDNNNVNMLESGFSYGLTTPSDTMVFHQGMVIGNFNARNAYLLFDRDTTVNNSPEGGANTPILACDVLNEDSLHSQFDTSGCELVVSGEDGDIRKISASAYDDYNIYMHMLEEPTNDGNSSLRWNKQMPEGSYQAKLATFHYIDPADTAKDTVEEAYKGYDLSFDKSMVNIDDDENNSQNVSKDIISVKFEYGDEGSTTPALRRTFNDDKLNQWYVGSKKVIIKSYKTLNVKNLTTGQMVKGDPIAHSEDDSSGKMIYTYTINLAMIKSDIEISHETSLVFSNPDEEKTVKFNGADYKYKLKTNIFANDTSANNDRTTVALATENQTHYYGQNIAYMVSPEIKDEALNGTKYEIIRNYDADTYAKMSVVDEKLVASKDTSSSFPTEVGTYLVRYSVTVRDKTDTSTNHDNDKTYTLDTIFTIERMPVNKPDIDITLKDGDNTIDAQGITYKTDRTNIAVDVKQNVMKDDGTPDEPIQLVKDTDYTYKIYEHSDTEHKTPLSEVNAAGEYDVVITGIENYDGTKTVSFKINPQSLATESISVDTKTPTTKTYDGKGFTGFELVGLPDDFKISKTENEQTQSGYSYRFKAEDATNWTTVAPKDAGMYDVEITATDLDGNYNPVVKVAKLTINRRSVNVESFENNESVYHQPLNNLKANMILIDGNNTTQTEGVVEEDKNLDFSKYFAVYNKSGNVISYSNTEQDAGEYTIGLVNDAGLAVTETEYKPTADKFKNYVINFVPNDQTKSYTITPADISNVKAVLSVEDGFTYDTTIKSISFKSVQEEFTGDRTPYNLVAYKDFTIGGELSKYEANDATYPAYKVRLIGKGNYKGEKILDWKINKAEINAVIPELTKEYDGNAVEATVDFASTQTSPAIQKDLASNASVTYEYFDNKNTKLDGAPTDVGSYKVVAHVTCKNYIDEDFEKEFEIKKANITAEIKQTSSSVVFNEELPTVESVNITGGIVESEASAVAEEIKNALKRSSESINVGTYNWVIPNNFVLDNYNLTGLTGAEYKITPKSLTKSDDITVTLSKNASVLTSQGAEIPTVTVKDGNKELVVGTDYRLTVPTSITKTGTYSIEVRGLGNYDETVVLPWIVYAEDESHAETTIGAEDPVLVTGETNKFDVKLNPNKADGETIVEAGFIWTDGTVDDAASELVVGFESDKPYHKQIVNDPNHSDSWTATFTDLSNGNGQGKGVTYRAYAIVTKNDVTYTVYGVPETKYARDLITENVKNNTSITLNAAKLKDDSSTEIEIAVGETKTLDGFTVKESGIYYVLGEAESIDVESALKWTKPDDEAVFSLADTKKDDSADKGQGFTYKGYVTVTDGINEFTIYDEENYTSSYNLMEGAIKDILTLSAGDPAMVEGSTNEIKIPVTAAVNENYADDFKTVESGVYYINAEGQEAKKAVAESGVVSGLEDLGNSIYYYEYITVSDGVNTYTINGDGKTASVRDLLGEIDYTVEIAAPVLASPASVDNFRNIEFAVNADVSVKGFALTESGIRYAENAIGDVTADTLKANDGVEIAKSADNKAVIENAPSDTIYYIGYAIYSDGINTFTFYSSDVQSVKVGDLLEAPVKAATSIKVDEPVFDAKEKTIKFTKTAECTYPGFEVLDSGVIFNTGKETEFDKDSANKIDETNTIPASVVKEEGITYKGYVTVSTTKGETYTVYTDAKYINPSDISMQYVKAFENNAVELSDESRVLNADGTIDYKASANAILDLDDFNAEVTETGILWIGIEQYGLTAANEKVNCVKVTDGSAVTMDDTGKGVSYRAYAIITAGDQTYTVYSPTTYKSTNEINAPMLKTSVTTSEGTLVSEPTDETYRDININVNTNTSGFDVVESGICYSTEANTAEALKNVEKTKANGGLITIKEATEPINYIGYVVVEDEKGIKYTKYTDDVKTVDVNALLEAEILKNFKVKTDEPDFNTFNETVTLGAASEGEYAGFDTELGIIYVSGEQTNFTEGTEANLVDNKVTLGIDDIDDSGISYKAYLKVTDKNTNYSYTIFTDAGYINKDNLIVEFAKEKASVQLNDPSITTGKTTSVTVTANATDYKGKVEAAGIVWRNGHWLDLDLNSEKTAKEEMSATSITADMTDDGNGISYRAYIKIKSGNKTEYKWSETQYITSKQLFEKLVADGGVASVETENAELTTLKSGKIATNEVDIDVKSILADAYKTSTENIVKETGILVYAKESKDESVELLKHGMNGVTTYSTTNAEYNKSVTDKGNGIVYRGFAVVVDGNGNEYTIYTTDNKEANTTELMKDVTVIENVNKAVAHYESVDKNAEDGVFYTYKLTPDNTQSNYDVTIAKAIKVKTGDDEWVTLDAEKDGSFKLNVKAGETVTYKTVVTATDKNGVDYTAESEEASISSEDAFNEAVKDLELTISENSDPAIVEDTTNNIKFNYVSGGNGIFDAKTGIKIAVGDSTDFTTHDADGNSFEYTAQDSGSGFTYKGFVTITDGVNSTTVEENEAKTISARDLIEDDVMAAIEVNMSDVAGVDDGKNNKMRVDITGAVDYDGFTVKKTGIIIVPGEQNIDNLTAYDSKFSNDGAQYSPSFRDADGKGYTYRGFVIVSDGTNDFVKYTDVATAKASVVFREQNVMNATKLEITNPAIVESDSKLNKMKVQINSSVDYEGFDVAETGIIIGEGDLLNKEFTIEAAEGSVSELNKFGTNGTVYAPSFRDKNGNGYTYVGFVTVTDGDVSYTKYTDPVYVKAADLMENVVSQNASVTIANTELLTADPQLNKIRLTINSESTLNGLTVTKTGLLIKEGENDGSEIVRENKDFFDFDTDGTSYMPSFRDKSGNGYSYRPYAIVTNGTDEFTVYGEATFITAAELLDNTLNAKTSITVSEPELVDVNKISVSINSSVNISGFTVSKTGLLIKEGESDGSVITTDNKNYFSFGTDGTTYAPSFRDKSGNGYTFRPYTIITNGTEEFTVYGEETFVTAEMLKN
jgi:hypothetical protein